MKTGVIKADKVGKMYVYDTRLVCKIIHNAKTPASKSVSVWGVGEEAPPSFL